MRRGVEDSKSGISPSNFTRLLGALSSQSGAASIGLRVGGSGSVSEWMRGGMESESSSLGGRDLSPVGERKRKKKFYTSAIIKVAQ